ncbi:MAG TPA: indolepyruvate oxidoreductase subunit beta [Prolixibacteraceae bacterium]|nr:indolepyruvate oxidoreductase subunit beta [Prolixibacteraceae bacterium]
MKTNIILAGVGGQGILSIAAVLGVASLKNNYHLKQAETHGMSQRGGAVMSHLRISDRPIASDLIPLGKADIILSVEPMESLRYINYLKPNGYIVTNTTPFINIPNYPDIATILDTINKQSHSISIDADKIAKEIGNGKASNMVMLGAASPFIEIPVENIEESIRQIFERKGEDIVTLNLRAFNAGRDFSIMNQNKKN